MARRGTVATALLLVATLLAGCGHGSKRRTAAATTTIPTTTVVVTTTTIAPTTYRVRRGDTLSGIAQRFGLSVAAIAAANGITNLNSIKEGQVIALPPRPPPTTTTTTPPAKLVITPASARVGAVFTLTLTGAASGETVTFQIFAPDNKKFTGPPHTAGADGTVSTDYVTSRTDKTGTYNVTATGNQGLAAQGSFRLDPATG